MQQTTDRCATIINAVEKGEVPATLTLWDIRRQQGRTAPSSIMMIKYLLSDFGVDPEDWRIIDVCEDASIKDNPIDAICSHICNLYGDDDVEFSQNTLAMFTKILTWCQGFRVDWKCHESEIEAWMNAGHLLKKYGLKISFSDIVNDTLEITLEDSKTGASIKSTFKYERDLQFIPLIIGKVNTMIAEKGLIFISSWQDGEDSYSYVLFDIGSLERLNAKYGHIGRLIHWTRRIDWTYEPRYPFIELDGEGNAMKVPAATAGVNAPYPPDTLFNRAVRIYLRGDWTNSTRLLRKNEEVCRESGDKKGLQLSLSCLGVIYQAWGAHKDALKVLIEDEALCRELGYADRLRFCLDSQARVRKRLGM